MLRQPFLGQKLVYGAVRTLNFAHGDVFALTSVLVITLIKGLGVQQDWPPALLVGALALTLAVAMLFGLSGPPLSHFALAHTWHLSSPSWESRSSFTSLR